MHTLVTILQIITAFSVIALMAVQTDKAEQGGVMGIGGRGSGDIDVAVGPERILKPLTKWMAIGFLFCSVLSAIPPDRLNIAHLIIALALYLIAMLQGNTIWSALTGTRR